MCWLAINQLTIFKQHFVFWGHTYLPRSRHILLCMCLHVCMYSCCAGDLSLPVVRLVDSFHLVMVNISREHVAYSHRFVRCFMDTCLTFPISMYVCMCSWTDLLFCLLNRNMDILYWWRQHWMGNRPWRRSFCWPEQILKQQIRWLTNYAGQNGLYVWRPGDRFVCDEEFRFVFSYATRIILSAMSYSYLYSMYVCMNVHIRVWFSMFILKYSMYSITSISINVYVCKKI